MKLLEKFSSTFRNHFKFSNKILKAAVKEWCEDSSSAKAKYGHISDWNTSKVTKMEKLFSAQAELVGGQGVAAKRFNGDISRWNVWRVVNMSDMFNGAEWFNQNLSGWNVEKCKNMRGMFYEASSFNQGRRDCRWEDWRRNARIERREREESIFSRTRLVRGLILKFILFLK